MASLSVSANPVRSEFADDPDFRELLELFVDSIPEKRAALVASYQASDFAQLVVVSHQMKGASGGYGFSELSQLAALLEQAGRSKSTIGVASALADVLAYLDRIAL